MSVGSRRCTAAIAACTSWAAASMFRSRVNTRVIDVLPVPLVEVIESMPAMVENCCSSTVATALDIVSGVAPDSEALTTMVGKSTVGRSLTGRSRKAMTPKRHSAPVSSVVITGRRMQSSGRFMASGFFRRRGLAVLGHGRAGQLVCFHPHPGQQAKLPVGHDGLAGLDAVRKQRVIAAGPRDLHGAQLDGLVRLHDV